MDALPQMMNSYVLHLLQLLFRFYFVLFRFYFVLQMVEGFFNFEKGIFVLAFVIGKSKFLGD
jgi:hypothetical protein